MKASVIIPILIILGLIFVYSKKEGNDNKKQEKESEEEMLFLETNKDYGTILHYSFCIKFYDEKTIAGNLVEDASTVEYDYLCPTCMDKTIGVLKACGHKNFTK